MNQEFDPFLERWLGDGPARVPDRVVRGAMDRIAAAPQERPVAGLGWPEMSTLGRLAVVGILAVVVGGFLWGGPRLVWVGAPAAATPTPSPSPSPTAGAGKGTDILATTKAHPLPSQATCPPGSEPDAPGPADQEQPSSVSAWSMAFDRHAGRIVVLAETGSASQTWTYDVCTNTWQRMSPAEEPMGGWGSPSPARLVYDADSDRTLAFGRGMRIWSYELAADRWTEVGSLPWPEDATTHGTIFYHDPSGLVVAYDGSTMWAYDVETDSLSRVRQQPDPSWPAGSGLPDGKVALAYDPVRDLVIAVVVPYEGVPDDPHSGPPMPGRYRAPLTRAGTAWAAGETWTFEPGTGQWAQGAAEASPDLIVCGVWFNSEECYPTYGRAVFDEASGRAIFMASDLRTRFATEGVSPTIVDVYDPGQSTWRTLYPTQEGRWRARPWCGSMPPVYDPVNERIVCQSGSGTQPGDGVSAFSTATGEWRWLRVPTS